MERSDVPHKELPLLVLRDNVILPGQHQQLPFGREKSNNTLELYQENSYSNMVLLTCQKDKDIVDPTAEDIYTIGAIANILDLKSKEEGGEKTFSLEIKSLERVKLTITQSDTVFMSDFEIIEDELDPNEDYEELIKDLKQAMKNFATISLSSDDVERVMVFLSRISSPTDLINFILTRLPTSIEVKQELLEEVNVKTRLVRSIALTNNEGEVQKMKKKIMDKFQNQAHERTKEMMLREQMRAIQKELGDESEEDDIAELEEKVNALNLPEHAYKAAKKELTRLRRSAGVSAEYSVIRTYLDWILDLPWNEVTEDILDLDVVKTTLDKGHYGLEEPKKRVLEFLAVQKLKEDNKGPILCFVGPPGVGKTTLAKSIAKSLNRKCERISLGGIHDDAQIRGHRRTYIGALPGIFISTLKKCGVKNPVIILDEIDKLGKFSNRGDAESALLEVLDPEQNDSFMDHYMELGFDLSQVMFICTGNESRTLHPALKDRMEVIEIEGYTEEEKISIAKQYLIDQERNDAGLGEGDLHLTEKAISETIAGYTREAGVRKLKQSIGKMARKIAVSKVTNKPIAKRVTNKNLVNYIGQRKYRRSESEHDNPPGVVTGLAWTPVGGVILFVEAAKTSGDGKLAISGNVAKVMEESSKVAFTYVKGCINALIFDGKKEISKYDFHIHFPEASEKDGPSAGVAQVVALISLITGQKVPGNIAMTGEISLRGKVLPIGGLKEKLLAAIRADVKKVFIPKDNEYELEELSKDITSKLEIIPVEKIDEVVFSIFSPLKKAVENKVELSSTVEVHEEVAPVKN